MRGLTIIYEPLLAERTSLGLGGRAVAEILLHDGSGLEQLPALLTELGGEPKNLGRGTNILASDNVASDTGDSGNWGNWGNRAGRLLPLTLVKVDFKDEPVVLPERVEVKGEPLTLVRVSASCPLPVLLGRLASWGLNGLEGLAGIPGNVGGAVAMNAGSYGCEIADCLREVTIFTLSGGVRKLRQGDFHCAYRTFKPLNVQSAGDSANAAEGGAPGVPGAWFIILEAVFALKSASSEQIRLSMRENIRRKKAAQPLQARSAGCLFKNPAPGISAGKLLDEAGFKGRRHGGMAFSELHANFLVNLGGRSATSAQAFELIYDAQKAVLERHGVMLEPEVKIWP